MNKPSIQSVAKAFSVLEYVLESSMISDGTGLAEIAERFGMQKTTARNMMQTLEFCGYIRRKERGHYAPGEKCAMLCKAGSFAERIRPIALPLLKSAAEETGDSFILTTLFNGERLMIASVSGYFGQSGSGGTGAQIQLQPRHYACPACIRTGNGAENVSGIQPRSARSMAGDGA